MYRIVTKISRPDAALIKEFEEICTADLADAMGKERLGCVDQNIKAVTKQNKFVGFAFTVQTHEGSNLILHKAMSMAQKDDVIVVDAGQNQTVAVWGGTFALICKQRSIRGAVIDGAVRDLAAINAIEFPVFARSVSPAGPSKLPGSINIPIVCGGIYITPGDLVVADADGVIVVPKEHIEMVLKAAKEVKHKAEDMERRVRLGEFPFDFLGMSKLLDGQNVQTE